MSVFTFSKFFILKLATDLISIENFLSADIGQVTDLRGVKLDRWPKSVIEMEQRILDTNAGKQLS